MSSAGKLVHTDHRYVIALLHNDGVLIRDIYERFSAKVKYYILENSGSEEDAADIFQEALMDICQQARYKNFILTCPFEPFLLLVCKRKWLNQLKSMRRREVTKDPDSLSGIGEDATVLADQIEMQEARFRLVMDMFQKLGKRCQEILSKCQGNQSQEEVARELGVTYAYLRKKKSECTAELIKLVRSKQSSTE